MQSSTLRRNAGPLLHVDASDCWQQGAKRSGISFTLARARTALGNARLGNARLGDKGGCRSPVVPFHLRRRRFGGELRYLPVGIWVSQGLPVPSLARALYLCLSTGIPLGPRARATGSSATTRRGRWRAPGRRESCASLARACAREDARKFGPEEIQPRSAAPRAYCSEMHFNCFGERCRPKDGLVT
jgi:hypothetical protein